MYACHKEDQHNKIIDRVERRRAKCQLAYNSGAPLPTNGKSSGKFVIKDKLKEVLCSRLMVSDTDADNICNKICGQGKE